MKVWTRLEHYAPDPARPLILALGNFDGVHLGHQRILKAVLQHASERKGTPAVLTFSEHPQRVLHHSQEPALLTSSQHRLFLFREMGIRLCFLLPFTIPFSKTPPEDFVAEWLVGRLGVSEVHLGYNAHFGLDRKGDSALVKHLSERFGFDFYETKPVKRGGEYVSSTLIRQAIGEGDLGKADQFLGRPFSIFASVVRGKGRGRELGFPTANLQPHSEILPPPGVYPVKVRERRYHLKPAGGSHEFDFVPEDPSRWHHGVLNFGFRPTFDSENANPIPEVFLFNFTGELYGKTLEVVFHPKLREERTFRDAKELVRAIQEDVARAQRYFQKGPGPFRKGPGTFSLYKAR